MIATARTLPAAGSLPTALGLSAAIALAGYRRGALSPSGALGAVLVGGSTYRAGGPRWSALLLAFFASSSALSRLEARSPAGAAIAAMAARGSRRDLVQAVANGGVAAAAALGHRAAPRRISPAAFAGALAAATADTWATEIGGLSRDEPRLITSGRRVPAGTSGSVSPAGLCGAAGGALLIGLLAGWLLPPGPDPRRAAGVALAGVLGSLVDSLLGASLQAGYRCPRCGTPTERRIHRCGAATERVRGLPWVTNDVVNLLCTLAGALAGAALAGPGPAAARTIIR